MSKGRRAQCPKERATYIRPGVTMAMRARAPVSRADKVLKACPVTPGLLYIARFSVITHTHTHTQRERERERRSQEPIGPTGACDVQLPVGDYGNVRARVHIMDITHSGINIA